ncbi:MAG TPA: HAMP domain-containing sensor histidine kinase [Candidatus Krumholzibacteria bacterium]|nr:HAMP domain-containing sensor histidine kinase [Candidatus Krumholzibacteria bacterium]HPD72660.1 HAMP domain-containing sensor histidine kinase [Candidatus Krumholzibacteria bacterium]HRY40408.1 HAMP domain-containing sensor histidine kinase [Candidatus Krumholzibacteria bacterium]
MSWPRGTNSLHFRVSALFLILLVLVGAVYYVWMERTVFSPPRQDAIEEHWYAELADAELDSLAALARGAPPERLQELASEYGASIESFRAEIVFFDAAAGQVLASSRPDSLPAAVGAVEPALLADMVQPDWNFDEVYPDPTNIDAYVNRIFHVAAVRDPQGNVTAYLAGSWQPLIFSEADVALDPHRLWLQTALIGVSASFVIGWLVMAWLTRRLRSLSAATEALAAGELTRRVRATSPDEIGRLGRDFNTMAARLESLVDELRTKELFQRRLIANISHDLRTPLASVRGYVDTLSLRGDGMTTSESQRYLTIIGDNLAHLDRLVDHLLQLSRLDAGQARFQFEDFPLPELVDSVLARCQVPAEAKRIRVGSDCPDGLPMVNADPLQIAQVLQNLIENGIKFGHEEGEVLVIARAQADGRVEVAVRDDGPGIAVADQPHIFERFFSGDRSRSRKGHSSGLGLAISAKIVEEHGSQLTVESQPGHGACFRFRLQAAQSSAQASQT